MVHILTQLGLQHRGRDSQAIANHTGTTYTSGCQNIVGFEEAEASEDGEGD